MNKVAADNNECDSESIAERECDFGLFNHNVIRFGKNGNKGVTAGDIASIIMGTYMAKLFAEEVIQRCEEGDDFKEYRSFVNYDKANDSIYEQLKKDPIKEQLPLKTEDIEKTPYYLDKGSGFYKVNGWIFEKFGIKLQSEEWVKRATKSNNKKPRKEDLAYDVAIGEINDYPNLDDCCSMITGKDKSPSIFRIGFDKIIKRFFKSNANSRYGSYWLFVKGFVGIIDHYLKKLKIPEDVRITILFLSHKLKKIANMEVDSWNSGNESILNGRGSSKEWKVTEDEILYHEKISSGTDPLYVNICRQDSSVETMGLFAYCDSFLEREPGTDVISYGLDVLIDVLSSMRISEKAEKDIQRVIFSQQIGRILGESITDRPLINLVL